MNFLRVCQCGQVGLLCNIDNVTVWICLSKDTNQQHNIVQESQKPFRGNVSRKLETSVGKKLNIERYTCGLTGIGGNQVPVRNAKKKTYTGTRYTGRALEIGETVAVKIG